MKDNLLKYMGGKNTLAEFIIKKMAAHTTYVEVYLGSATIYLQKPIAKVNVLNDFNGNLVNLYMTVMDKDKKEYLSEMLENTLYSREMFLKFRQMYDSPNEWMMKESVLRAYLYLYLNRVSFNGMFKSYARRDDSSVLYSLDNTIKSMSRMFHAGKAVIEKLSFDSLLLNEGKLRYDNKDTLLYADPPYWVTTEPGNEYYEKLMSKKDHEVLRDLLFQHKKAKWLLSYDDHDKVRNLYGLPTRQKDGILKSTTNPNVMAILTPDTFQSSASLMDGETKYLQELLIANYNLETTNTLFDDES